MYLFYLEDIVIDKSNGSKCNLFATKEGIVTDPEKIKAVAEWPIPSDVSDACSFLWLWSYQRGFISYIASEANLRRFTVGPRKGVNFNGQWRHGTPEQIDFCTDIGITRRIFTFYSGHKRTQPFNRAVLSQEIEEKECMIAYASCILTKAVKGYCVTRKELLAVVHFMNHFCHYLYIYI